MPIKTPKVQSHVGEYRSLSEVDIYTLSVDKNSYYEIQFRIACMRQVERRITRLRSLSSLCTRSGPGRRLGTWRMCRPLSEFMSVYACTAVSGYLISGVPARGVPQRARAIGGAMPSGARAQLLPPARRTAAGASARLPFDCVTFGRAAACALQRH